MWNIEKDNKSWMEENKRICVFCGLEQDKIEYYIEDCVQVKGISNYKKDNYKKERLWSNKLDKEKERFWKGYRKKRMRVRLKKSVCYNKGGGDK